MNKRFLDMLILRLLDWIDEKSLIEFYCSNLTNKEKEYLYKLIRRSNLEDKKYIIMIEKGKIK